METVVSEARPRLSGLALALLGAACSALALVSLSRSDGGAVTTYAATSSAAEAADLAAGLALIAAGVLAWTEPRARPLGALSLLAGCAWLGADLDGWERGTGLVRAVGAAAMPFLWAFVLHLTLAFPGGRLRSRAARAGVVAAYATGALVSVGLALVDDPLLDLHCWRNCLENVLLLRADPGAADALRSLAAGAGLAVGLTLLATSLWRLFVATRPARRLLAPVLVPAAIAGGCEAAYAVALFQESFERPESATFSSLFVARSLALVGLAAGLSLSVVRARRARRAVERLATDLGTAPPPGTLQADLRAALGDPALQVVYPLPGLERCVDGMGRTVPRPVSSPGRAVTPIERDRSALAFVVHDTTLVDGARLGREIGSAARLAIANEQLQAEVLARLDDLRLSRARVVERSDAERRRLERDLHDGAQQQLLAFSYDLRLARAGAEEHGDRELATLLAAAVDEAQAAIDDLRHLAHGIYPAVLTESGLLPALRGLADTAPVVVELRSVTGERFAEQVETAAYVIVAEALDDAARRGARVVVAGASRVRELLVVEVEDDGSVREADLAHVADRVGALRGTVRFDVRTVRAELPCV